MFPSRAFYPSCRQGFTLIELLVVITIILVLAGLVIGVVGNVQYKSSFARATSEIRAMETAMESYKVDNGAYPRDPSAANGGKDSTDNLDARSATAYAQTAPDDAYIASSKFLFKMLSGISSATAAPTKAYITFIPSQLSTASATPTPDTTYIVDPWGLSYGYSTAFVAEQEAPNNSTAASTKGYNPTFDLWSTAGYGKSGKTYPTSMVLTDRYTLWAKNW